MSARRLVPLLLLAATGANAQQVSAVLDDGSRRVREAISQVERQGDVRVIDGAYLSHLRVPNDGSVLGVRYDSLDVLAEQGLSIASLSVEFRGPGTRLHVYDKDGSGSASHCTLRVDGAGGVDDLVVEALGGRGVISGRLDLLTGPVRGDRLELVGRACQDAYAWAVRTIAKGP